MNVRRIAGLPPWPNVTRLVLALVAALAVSACSSSGPSGAASSAAPVPTTSTSSTTLPAGTTTSVMSSTTVAPADPDFDDIPEGRCADLVAGSISFRNTTGNLAEEYRRIGVSTEGRTIWAEHWGSRDGPQVLVLGQVHGDECAPAFMVQAIRERPPVDFGIWLVPTVNPDGLAGFHRATALDIDPNRDGFDLLTPEAQTVMHITEEVQPVLTIHVHSPYKWVGAHNGPLATQVANAMSQAAGWGPARNAGRVRNGTKAFLWQGQELVIPGHQSVLVEFPAISPLEAPDAPDPAQRQEGSVADVRVAAVQMRDALYGVVSTIAP